MAMNRFIALWALVNPFFVGRYDFGQQRWELVESSNLCVSCDEAALILRRQLPLPALPNFFLAFPIFRPPCRLRQLP